MNWENTFYILIIIVFSFTLGYDSGKRKHERDAQKHKDSRQ